MAIRSYLESQYQLSGNPFPGQATYSEDGQQLYVPEMFGPQRDEFLRKFVLAPLENNQPLLGAVWSILPGDPKARGFGKSTLMGEEAKQINADFGFSTLRALDIGEAEARENPVLAGYVSFNTKSQGGIANIDSAAFHLVRFILRSVRDESRVFAILWGISVIEPGRLPLSLLCEAVARGGEGRLSRVEVDAVQHQAPWACRPLQDTISGLSRWISGEPRIGGYGPTARLRAKEILDIQEQIGRLVLDWLDEESPDWIDEAAEQTWRLVGGW